MTAWVVFCVLSLCMATPHAVRARRTRAQPLFESWVTFNVAPAQDAAETQAVSHVTLDQVPGSGWTKLDDRQLERLLSESSS